MQAILSPEMPSAVGNVMRSFRGRARIGCAHIGDDHCSCRTTHRQQGAHSAIEESVVTAAWIGHPVSMGEGDGTLAEAFEHHRVEFAAPRKIDGRLEAIGGKTRAGSDAECAVCFGHATACVGSIALQSGDIAEAVAIGGLVGVAHGEVERDAGQQLGPAAHRQRAEARAVALAADGAMLKPSVSRQ